MIEFDRLPVDYRYLTAAEAARYEASGLFDPLVVAVVADGQRRYAQPTDEELERIQNDPVGNI